jgi:hypothetical protein
VNATVSHSANDKRDLHVVDKYTLGTMQTHSFRKIQVENLELHLQYPMTLNFSNYPAEELCRPVKWTRPDTKKKSKTGNWQELCTQHTCILLLDLTVLFRL